MEINKAYENGDNEDGIKRFHAMCIIMSAESDRQSGIWKDLKNSTLMDIDNYPKNTTAAYDVLCRYKKTEPPRQLHAPHVAVTLVQSCDTENNKKTSGNDGRSFPEVTRYS